VLVLKCAGTQQQNFKPQFKPEFNDRIKSIILPGFQSITIQPSVTIPKEFIKQG
jgi:hypothetical protein